MNIPETKPHLTNSDDVRETVAISALGLCYVVTSAFRLPVLEHVFGYVVPPSKEFISDYGVLQFIALAGYLLSLILAIAIILRIWPSGLLATSFQLSAGPVLVGMGMSIVLSIILDRIGLWPYTWRWHPSEVLPFARALKHGSHAGYGYSMWILTTAVLIPLIEEVVFRVGVLRLFATVSRSSAVGIICSSLLFGIAHVSWWDLRSTSLADWVNATWAAVLGLVLGWLALRRTNLSAPLGVHIGRNLTEVISIVLTVKS